MDDYAADIEMDLRHEATGEWSTILPVMCTNHPDMVAVADWPVDPPVPPPDYFDLCDDCAVLQACDGCERLVPVGVLVGVEVTGQQLCPDCAAPRIVAARSTGTGGPDAPPVAVRLSDETSQCAPVAVSRRTAGPRLSRGRPG